MNQYLIVANRKINNNLAFYSLYQLLDLACSIFSSMHMQVRILPTLTAAPCVGPELYANSEGRIAVCQLETIFFLILSPVSFHGDCMIPDVDFIVPLWSARFAGVSDLLPKSVFGVNGE